MREAGPEGLRGLPLTAAPPQPCPYLPDRVSVSVGFACDRLPGAAYEQLLDLGFRRSGRIVYRPECPGCRSCVPLRVPVERFEPSRSQRRALRRNDDLAVEVGPPRFTQEKHRLYRRYLEARHPGGMTGQEGELAEFLCRSPTETLELCFRDGGGVLRGVSVCDLTPGVLSSVYCYVDPDEPRRSLGVASSLVEIRLARALGRPYYHLGYWVEGSPKMTYKDRFRPCELLRADGRWRPLVPVSGEARTGF